jgi:hypothetical protein
LDNKKLGGFEAPEPTLTIEIDHIFVCAAVGAPEASRLIQSGVTEGESNIHPGQGTANRRFFFHNAMLELLWVHDEVEARSAATQRTRLFERWRRREDGACPFGVCFRPTGSFLSAPFSGWDYAPSYLPPPLTIHIGNNSEVLAEPMLFHMTFGSRPDKAPEARRQRMEHPIGFREITRLRWIRPEPAYISSELGAALSCDSFSVASGRSHALEIGFDHESRGKSLALTPNIPITFYW